MPEHGEHDDEAQKWFCGYWMTKQEWEDVHDYVPTIGEKVVSGESGESAESDDLQ